MDSEKKSEDLKTFIVMAGTGIWLAIIVMIFLPNVIGEKSKEDYIIEIGVVTNITKEKTLFREKYILEIETDQGRYVKSISDETKVLYNIGSEVIITRKAGEDSLLYIELSENDFQ